jgi:arabinosaccharide transport system substrate-binding protein
MKRKALVGMTALALVSGMLLAGCSDSSGGGKGGAYQSSASGDAGSKKSSSPVKLVLWTFNELHGKFYQIMAESWNKENPDQPIVMEADTFPYDDMHNKLLVALQSGTGAPDLSDIEISKFANYLMGTPQLVELNPIVEPELKNIVKSRVDIYAKNGKYYGIDFHVGAEVMYYNKELLDKAGVNPDAIVTWNDYEEAGKKVLAATGKPMTTLETGDQWSFWPLISQQKSDYLDKDGNVILDNDTNVKTLQFLQKLIQEKIAVVAPGGGHHAEEYYGFMNKGGAASVWMPMWYMGRFTDYMPDLKGKIIIRPMPVFEKGEFRSAGMGGTGTAVTKQSKNQQLAMKFLAYAKLSREGNIQIWKQLGFDPIRTDVWDAPELKEDNKFTQYFGKDIFKTLISVKDEIYPVNIGEKTPPVSDAVKTKVMLSVLQDGKDPAQTLKAVSNELRK